KSLSKALVKGATFRWVEAASDVIDAVSCVGFEQDHGRVAWVLLHRAMLRAVFHLIDDSAGLLPRTPQQVPEEVTDALESALGNPDVPLDRDLFRYPGSLPVVAAVGAQLKAWLVKAGMEEAQAAAVAGRLPGHFTWALSHEWRRRPQDFAILKELDTPFTP